MENNWDFLLSEFRKLGGIADNICQKEGEFGRGIFCVNSGMKARIFTPSKLLIKKDHIYLEDNKLRIKKNKEYNQEITKFFNFYQENFSWGAGGRETTELFEKGLSLFNPKLKKLIKKYALVDIDLRHKGNWDDVIKKQFLNARQIKFEDSSVIAPVWELVNHKVRSLPFKITKEGVSTPNYPILNNEIRFSYGNIGPTRRFFNYGFFSEETIVYSIPFSLNILDQNIYISCKGICLKDDSMKIERSGNKITLEGLPIADINNPRLPYEYFYEIARRIGNIDIRSDLLSKIFQFNISIRKKIIHESQMIDHEVSKALIKVMDYEINLIPSHN